MSNLRAAMAAITRVLLLLAFLAPAGLTLSACEDGPAEEAGETIDEAGDEVEDATD